MTVLNDGRSNYEVRVWVRIKRLSDYFQSFSLFNYLIFPHSCLFIYFRNIFFRKVMYLCRQIKIFSSNKYKSSNPQPIGFSGILLAKRQNSFYCTYFLHNRNVADTKSPYPIKRLEVIRWFNQKSMVFNQSLS